MLVQTPGIQPAAEEALLAEIADQACAATGADGAAIALEENGSIVCVARAGRCAPPVGATLDKTSGVSGLCLRSGTKIRCDDADTDERVDLEAAKRLGIRSIIAVPLQIQGATLGLIEVFAERDHAFGAEADCFLEQSAVLALGIYGAKHYGGAPAEPPQLNQAADQVWMKAPSDTPVAADAELPEELQAAFPPALLEAPAEPASVMAASELDESAFSGMESAPPARRVLLMFAATVLLIAAAGGAMWWRMAEKRAPQPELSSSSNATVSAFQALRSAAEQGDAAAQYDLGMAYSNGADVPQDQAQSVNWLGKAADQGDHRAQLELGRAYAAGLGVPVDHVKAYAFLVLANADGGSDGEELLKALAARMSAAQIAQVRTVLGDMYAQGAGTRADKVSAYTWYSLADAAGSAEGQRAKAALASKMSRAQIAAATRRASEWLKRHRQQPSR
ncbi:MAG: GAF domain-containing protein [Terriglobales bacterium]